MPKKNVYYNVLSKARAKPVRLDPVTQRIQTMRARFDLRNPIPASWAPERALRLVQSNPEPEPPKPMPEPYRPPKCPYRSSEEAARTLASPPARWK
jgi:hypothetical protein